jgi:hypothetical protein
MRKWLTILIFVSADLVLFGQTTENLRFRDRLCLNFSAGIQGFSTSGIPKSRNQINVETAGLSRAPLYQQESRIAGLAFDLSVHYKLKPKLRLGLLVNSFRDDDEYFGTTDLENSVVTIRNEGLNSLTIRNMQAYTSLGLSAIYDLFGSENRRNVFSASFSAGHTFNRTPKRSEYDFFEENNFILADTQGSDNDWYITHTIFNNGWNIMPGASYSRIFKNKNAFFASFEMGFHWLSTAKEIQLLDRVSSGTLNAERYTMRVVQIKLGYVLN